MTDDVPSPCIDVCRMNPNTELCDGCLRTLDEIAGWSSFDAAHKRAVLAQAAARREAPRVVRVGECFSATLSLPPDSIKSFATLAGDHNPLHHDDAYAESSRFGSLIASATQPSAHLMAMVATHFSRVFQPLGLEFGFKLKRAVKAHDVLTMTWRIIDARWKPSLNGDLVELEGEAVNQHGETTITATARILVMPKEARA
jgi:acyl dehydratase